MEVDALPIPAREAMHRERVTQIVRTRTDAAASGLESRAAEQL